MDDGFAFTFPFEGLLPCAICKGLFTVLIWSDELKADFCNPCFDKWYDKLIAYKKRKDGEE